MPDLPSPPSTAAALGAERVLAGRYRLVRRLARGGMAEVWEAVDEVLSRPVAVKVLHAHLAADAGLVARFRREAVAAARLSHPHIVGIYDTCADGDLEAIVMELVRGLTLRQVLDRRGALPPHDAAAITAQVADALHCAHEAGIVHRDVKPGNVLLTADGRVLVADFGIAKALQEDSGGDLTATNAVVGTAKYLAPEQVTGGPVDSRTDVYALGVVLYEMLTGKAPFDAGSQLATAVLRLQEEPLRPRQHRAGIPRGLEDVVRRAMARRPDDRYPTAAAMRAALLGTEGTDGTDGFDLDAVAGDPTAAALTTDDATGVDLGHDAPSFAQTERSWMVPAVVILLVATALAVTGVTIGRTDVGRSLLAEARQAVGGATGVGPSTPPPQVVDVDTFDPQGTDGENDDDVPLLLDGDPDTTWSTERYYSRADFLGLKDGVGVVVVLDHAGPIEAVEVRSSSENWAAEIYVAGTSATSIAGWGDPVAGASGIDGDHTFDLGGVEGGYVLLWITDIGTGDPALAEVGEVRVLT